jgi:hypothetical protein
MRQRAEGKELALRQAALPAVARLAMTAHAHRRSGRSGRGGRSTLPSPLTTPAFLRGSRTACISYSESHSHNSCESLTPISYSSVIAPSQQGGVHQLLYLGPRQALLLPDQRAERTRWGQGPGEARVAAAGRAWPT